MTSAIEHLYQVFEKYQRPAKMLHSPLVAGGNIFRAITRSPLREIPHEYLSAYAGRALTTVGDVNDFRHFLPRILELLAYNLDQEIDPEIVLGKLEYAKWTQWPTDEQEAIRNYLRELWRNKSQEDLDTSLCDTWLCAIAQAEDDLMPYLSTLPSTPPSLTSAFWENRPNQHQQALDHLRPTQQRTS